ncbi:GNAT family acetyltransferase [Chryseobacterium sp. StRB126]|uniref:GNAT family N-acetyltransferase n=1 Tax=Chryseobacterium sp. StRB126 TaxID=878220 RepID=UPI0004E98D7D|nr:GNAT family N-acetyltransferase [Chryseobacterium sp. StRB126]BAP31134.1 GNAT family acetyltransferase [Chryseobacterium sp. StRB126]
MNIEYRKLLSHESSMYRMIRLESLEQFPDSFEANYQEVLNTEKLRMEIDIENQTPEKFVFGAFADQKLIGLCTFVKDEANSGNIYQMYVNKNFQGKNIGSGLVQAVIYEAKEKLNVTEVYLEVAHNNESAYHLYKKNGFNEIEPQNSGDEISKVTVMKYIV